MTEVPWPYMKQKEAARTLGVSVEYLAGLANNPITAIKSEGATGGTVWLFKKEDVMALRRRMDGGI